MILNIIKLWFLFDGKWFISMVLVLCFLKDRIFLLFCNDLKEVVIILERIFLLKLW